MPCILTLGLDDLEGRSNLEGDRRPPGHAALPDFREDRAVTQRPGGRRAEGVRPARQTPEGTLRVCDFEESGRAEPRAEFNVSCYDLWCDRLGRLRAFPGNDNLLARRRRALDLDAWLPD